VVVDTLFYIDMWFHCLSSTWNMREGGFESRERDICIKKKLLLQTE
jgi:hypothetical protein